VIRAIGLVVPAHDEELLLPRCLAALHQAAGQLPDDIAVHLVVAADACTDDTALQAALAGADVVPINARNVGAARGAGIAEVLRRTGTLNPADVWLATTDADTLVPSEWLSRQLQYAGQGWDMVLGTVTVTDWTGHPPHLPDAFAAHYGYRVGPHPHVHGANLGLRASAYLAAGGFKALRTAEDHDLLAAVIAAGGEALRAPNICVDTSARRLARAPGGFSHLLGSLTKRQSGLQFRAARIGQPGSDHERVPTGRRKHENAAEADDPAAE
jgi:glycosyltransferase involved in cell wall biosynthesis